MPDYKGESGFNWDDLMRGFQRYRGEGYSGRPEYESDFFEALMELAPEALEAGGGGLPEVPVGKGGPDYYEWANQADPGLMQQLEDYILSQREQATSKRMAGYADELGEMSAGTGKSRWLGPNLGKGTPENISKVWELFHPGK